MQGAIVEGVIEANDEKSAIERLKNAGYIPLNVAAPRESINKKISLRSSKGDVLTFTTELSVLLAAGITPRQRSQYPCRNIRE